MAPQAFDDKLLAVIGGQEWTGEFLDDSKPWKQDAPQAHFDPRELITPGQAVEFDSQFYLERDADTEVLDVIARPRGMVTVCGPNGSGKTSLIMATYSKAANLPDPYRCVYVDFQFLASDNFATLDSTWRAVFTQIAQQLGFEDTDLGGWNSDADPSHNIYQFVSKKLFKTDKSPVLVVLDEVDRLFEYPIAQQFFANLRAIWNQGAIRPAYRSLRWLLGVLALPDSCGGAFVTGATMANFTALAAARHATLKEAGWDVEADGLFGAPEVTVIVGEEAHPSLTKSLGMLGFGRERVTTVPVDDQGRMRAGALPPISGPTIVCIQAGNVNTGAFDPAAEICAAAREAGAWVHIDGAFGLWAAVSPEREHLVAGVADAHSWATDAHKWLNVPYDSGVAFVREPEHLRAAMALTAAYLPVLVQREPSHYTPELSRRARGVEVWAAMRTLGRAGLADLVDRTCRYATRFATGLREAGYEILNDVVLNQLLVSFGDDETTNRVIEGIQADGTCWCGGTVWQGRTAMRISVISWATTEEDVERSLAAMLRVADAAKS
ncbi:MAG: AAA-like domain-containing protein [Chloroflexi bacterium]|nr:AAA-like domain-containing protein [Chloroflexota bacterium]